MQRREPFGTLGLYVPTVRYESHHRRNDSDELQDEPERVVELMVRGTAQVWPAGRERATRDDRAHGQPYAGSSAPGNS